MALNVLSFLTSGRHLYCETFSSICYCWHQDLTKVYKIVSHLVIGGTHWISTLLTRFGTKITTLTYTGFLNKLSVKDAEITLTASWITDPLLHELIILIVQPCRTVPLVAFYFLPSYSIMRAVTALNHRTMLAKFCSQFCCPPLQLLPWFICELYVELNEGIPNF